MPKGEKKGHLSGLFIPSLMMKWSFTELCNAFTKAPVLAHFDPVKPICLKKMPPVVQLLASSCSSKTTSA
jgi:hypothetical protein